MSRRTVYEAYPVFACRIPSLPLDALQLIPADPHELPGFVRQQWTTHTYLRLAVGIASPSLARALDQAVNLEGKEADPQVWLSFLKYYTRMAIRPTPFGLFAGAGSGTFSTEPARALKLAQLTGDNIHLRLDMGYAERRVRHLMAGSAFRHQLRYDTNHTLYRLGEEFRYTRIMRAEDGSRRYRLEAAGADAWLCRLLEAAESPQSFASLSWLLIQEGAAESEAKDLVDQLIEEGVLISELEPELTRREYSRQLTGYRCESGPLPALAFAHELMHEGHQWFAAAARETRWERAACFQADLHRPLEQHELSVSVGNQVLFGLRILRALTEQEAPDRLGAFRKAFMRRFGDRDVPLCEVMDPDFGIGLEGPVTQQQTDPSDLTDDLGALTSRATPVEPKLLQPNPAPDDGLAIPDYMDISREQLAAFDLHAGSWPEQINALVSLSGSPDQPVISFLMAAEGNPASLMNRFSFLPDERLSDWLQCLLDDEEAAEPGKILAEIVHLPEGRTGNILQRKVTLRHEIPLMARASSDQDHIIRLADLLVRVEHDRVRLLHRKSGKEIIPVLHNAHHFETGQWPLYEFLVWCGKQDRDHAWYASVYQGNKQGKVPGVRYRNLLLRPPRWYVSLPPDIRRKGRKADPHRLADWALKQGLPEQVVLVTGDRHLYVDWSKPTLVISFATVARSLRELVFEPFRYAKGSLVNGSDGDYANEVVICYKKKR